jgi:hypothetical protein
MQIRGVLWILSALPLLLISCGGEEAAPEKIRHRDDPCVTCQTEPEEKPIDETPIEPHMAVEPAQLLFYGEGGQELPPAEAIVRNLTDRPVAITAVHVADDLQSIYGPGSASYFHVSGLDGPTVLDVGKSLTLTVNFTATPDQRAALLLIEAQDVDEGGLVVELSGKYFTGTGTF